MLQRGSVARKEPAFRCYPLENSRLPAIAKKLILARQTGLIFFASCSTEGVI
jgi:hypothetical protein